jgi:hypothetical protein
MKKLISILLGAILLVSLIPSTVLADPPPYQPGNPPGWFPFPKNHVTDPLVGTTGSGYIRFLCQSKQGFEYSVGIKGLTPGSTYSVEALSLPTILLPPGTPVPTSDGSGVLYALGSITTDGEGEGELDDGLISLPSTNPFLPFGAYNWVIRVKDSTGTIVLQSVAGDEADFIVIP